MKMFFECIAIVIVGFVIGVVLVWTLWWSITSFLGWLAG